nr:DUF4839 domain-containing protein [Aeromicrobium senzhongii]
MTFRRPKPTTLWARLASFSPGTVKPINRWERRNQLRFLAAAGAGVALIVAISITAGGDDDAPVAAPTKATAKPTEKVTTQPPKAATEPTEAPAKTTAPAPVETLTVKNSKDLAALLKAGEFDEVVSTFAKKYEGRTIAFDGNVANVAAYDIGSNILILANDYSETTASGPNFQFKDADLPLLSQGDNVRVKAVVVGYDDNSGLFELEPVMVRIR